MRNPIRTAFIIFALLASTPSAQAAPVAATNERIKLAVLDLKANGVPNELADTLTSIVASELQHLDIFSVISQQEIRALLTHETLQQLAGCETGACTTNIGGALGVKYLVSGNIGAVDKGRTLNLALTETSNGAVAGRESVTVPENSQLLDAAARTVKVLVSKILGERKGSLILNCQEKGASVKLDGSVMGVTPLQRLSVSWGPHLLEVEKKGFITAQEDFSMQTNGAMEKTVTLIPSPDFVNDYESGARGMRIGAWVLSAVAAGSVGAAIYFQVAQTQQSNSFAGLKKSYEAESTPLQSDYDALTKVHNNAETDLTLTYVFIGAAVACAGGATYFWVAGSDPDRYSRYRGIGMNDIPVGSGKLSFNLLQPGYASAQLTW